ncbi:MAG: BTAD domain-containing putative transcriptional regulator, partial [Micromonosporaceae bacterium]
MSFDFRLLGPVEVYANGQQLALGPRQQRLVAAVLALEATKVVSVDLLVDLVWPDSPPRTAVHAIQVCVSRLRTVLVAAEEPTGVELVGRDAGYALLADPLTVDAHRFRRMLKQARAAGDEDRMRLLDRALGLWRGPALAGTASEQVRNRLCGGLEEARLVATEELLQARLRLEGHRDVLEELTELVGAHPLREELVGQLMVAYYRGGRRGAALDLYEQTRRRMAEEFGADLSGPLQRLHLAMLRGDRDLDASAPAPRSQPAAGPGVDHPVPAQLPPVVAGFAGRTVELSTLDLALAESRTTPTMLLITAIGGTPGVGKTALAIWWAQRVKEHFPDGQLFLNLRGFGPTGQPMPPTEAVRACLDALGVRPDAIPASFDAQVGKYRSLMAGRRMLVVLDNAATADQVRPLLPGTPSCMVVVTSRAALTGLVVTEGARPITLDVFSAAESRELLRSRLGRA